MSITTLQKRRCIGYIARMRCKTQDALYKGGLTTAIGSYDAYKVIFVYIKGDTLQRLCGIVAHRYAFKSDKWLHTLCLLGYKSYYIMYVSEDIFG